MTLESSEKHSKRYELLKQHLAGWCFFCHSVNIADIPNIYCIHHINRKWATYVNALLQLICQTQTNKHQQNVKGI